MFNKKKKTKEIKLEVKKPEDMNTKTFLQREELENKLKDLEKRNKFFNEEYQKSQDTIRKLTKENKELKRQIVENSEGKIALNIINMLQDLFTDRNIGRIVKMQEENQVLFEKILSMQRDDNVIKNQSK